MSSPSAMIARNWKDLIRPKAITVDDGTATPHYAKFVCEPLERGFGLTLGNALRRVLLSSLQGTAITAVRIDGALHEFTSVPDVTEDVTDIILNLKGVVVRSEGPVLGRVGDAPVRLSVDARTAEPGVLAEGIFAGLAASLTVSPLGISGHVGRCDYSLPQAGSRYEGWRTCGETRAERRPERVTLTLPEEALSLGDTEEAALLALLLSDVTVPPETRG